MNGAQLDGWKNNKTGWDFAIEPIKIYEIANKYCVKMVRWYYLAKSHIQAE